jgi:Fe-Mn family superoxide dismutase
MLQTKISRRRFLGTLGLGTTAGLLAACSSSRPVSQVPTATVDPTLADVTQLTQAQDVLGEYLLPNLPYAFNALEPHIDEQTMQIHHDRHHAGYVNRLNSALETFPEWREQSLTLPYMLAHLDELPENIRTTVRRNGGGHINHTLYWLTMSPTGGGEPTGALAEAITRTFGDFATFKSQLTDAGSSVFGSGWGWLVMDGGNLQITTTANQDSPYMQGQTPLLGVDVWEHAYYLKYKNRRGEYIDAWWNVIDWDAVNRRYEAELAEIPA